MDDPQTGLTPALRREFLKVIEAPQLTYGATRARLQNRLEGLGLAEFQERDGISFCVATPAGHVQGPRAKAEEERARADAEGRESPRVRRDREAAWRFFPRGHWTRKPPRVPGRYPVATLGGSFEGQFVDVTRAGRSIEVRPPWEGWFWSRPLPTLPKPPKGGHKLDRDVPRGEGRPR